ncbi:MAG: hypothetical protein ACLFPP_12355 [Spirochaetaceae bacterium]
MHRSWVLLAATFALFVTGCEESEEYPEAKPDEAVLALEDVLLVSGTSMFLLFESEGGEAGEVGNDSESVVLTWENVDQEDGSGTYTITLADHTVGEESVFASDYNGYSMTGSIVLESQGPGSNTIFADLDLLHDTPEQFPVRTLVMELSGTEEREGRIVPTGSFAVNGREIDLELMSAAFE